MANEKLLIDAKPLMQNGWHLVKTGESNRFICSMSLADVPTVDAVEVVHGYDTGRCRIFHCSKCGYGVIDIFQEDERNYPVGEFNYCPNCGAKMDGDVNG